MARGPVVCFAKAAGKARLAAFFLSAGFVARLGQFARLPQSLVFATIPSRDYLVAAFLGFAILPFRHCSFARVHGFEIERTELLYDFNKPARCQALEAQTKDLLGAQKKTPPYKP